jgi:hypothetical protein
VGGLGFLGTLGYNGWVRHSDLRWKRADATQQLFSQRFKDPYVMQATSMLDIIEYQLKDPDNDMQVVGSTHYGVVAGALNRLTEVPHYAQGSIDLTIRKSFDALLELFVDIEIGLQGRILYPSMVQAKVGYLVDCIAADPDLNLAVQVYAQRAGYPGAAHFFRRFKSNLPEDHIKKARQALDGGPSDFGGRANFRA